MTTATTVLRPGYLVNVSTSIKGNVSYSKQDLEFLQIEKGSKTKWETERFIKDEAEQERASEVRSKARGLIASVCSASAEFGYLCPLDRKPDLDKAFIEAEKLVADFNATSKVTYIRFHFATGYVADNDEVAIKAINREVRNLLEDMKEGVEKLDVKRVRDAASKATQLGQTLTADAEARVMVAVNAARDAAKRIVKAGENAAIEIDRATVNRIKEARTAFLDLDDSGKPIEAPAVVGRAIDLTPDDEAPKVSAPAPKAAQFEIG